MSSKSTWRHRPLTRSRPVKRAREYNLEIEIEGLRKLLESIYKVASGEDQVAIDDTEGMEWIANKIKQELEMGE